MHTKTDLLEGNILKSLILFAIPLIISNLFQQLYNAADTMIVGHFLGDESLAAIGACAAVYELLVGFALGFGNGLSMVVARSFGVGDKDLLKRAVAGSLVIGAAVTVGVMLIAQIGLRPLLVLLHTPSEIIEESYSYIYIVTICVGVMFAYNLLSGLLRAIGNSFMPLAFLIISSVINIVLDVLFITQFQMGIRGAAVACPHWWVMLLPFVLFALIIFVDAALQERSLGVGLRAVAAAYIQLWGYGSGFWRAWWRRCVLGKGEFEAFSKNFYK